MCFERRVDPLVVVLIGLSWEYWEEEIQLLPPQLELHLVKAYKHYLPHNCSPCLFPWEVELEDLKDFSVITLVTDEISSIGNHPVCKNQTNLKSKNSI